jgi:tetratricopeptide (TPR) repeat protein
MLVYVALNWRKRDLLAWCFLFYLLTMFIVSNIVINIGAPMGERFLFQASLAFVVGLVYTVKMLGTRLKFDIKLPATVILVAISLAAFAKTYTRNQVWYDGNRLGLTDVKISSNSARANTYAGTDLINISDTIKDTAEKRHRLQKALSYFYKSLKIQPHFITTFQNMGVAFHRLKKYDSADYAWQEVRIIDPHNNNLPMYDAALRSYRNKTTYDPLFARGVICGQLKRYDSAVYYFKKAITFDKNEPEGWYNLGGAYFSLNRFDSARICWKRCVSIKPDHQQAIQGLAFLDKTHK